MKKTIPGCVVEKCIRITSLFTVFENTYEEDYYFVGESHNFWEFVCVIDGTLGVTAGKDVFPLERGQAVLHKPMEFHRIWAEKGTRPHIAIISFAGDIMPDMKERRFTLQGEELQKLCEMIRTRNRIFQVEKGYIISKLLPGQEVQAHLFLAEFENLLLTALSRKDPVIQTYTSVSVRNYRRIVKVLEACLEERLTLPEIAKLCHMSEATVKKTFSRYAGIGLMTYFNQLKIRRAVSLLEEGYSVGQTAAMLGFGDQNYFSTVFKRVIGESPMKYIAGRNETGNTEGI